MTPLVERLRLLPPAGRAALFAELGAVPGALSDVRYDWSFWAHEHQVVTPEEIERFGLILFTGPRGTGKTEAAVHTFNREILEGRAEAPRIFAATEADADKTVVHGLSGIMRALPRDLRPRWMAGEGTAGVLRYTTFAGNRVDALCFGVKSAETAVGNAGDLDLYDDYAKWGPNAETALAHARLSCRVGYACGLMATTRRGVTLLRKLLTGDVESVLVKRPTDLRVNRFNLSPKNYRSVLAEFGTTDLVRQELEDEDVSASSPFAGLDFDAKPIRVLEINRADFVEVIVAADPADGKGGEHDDWGIGVAGRRRDGHVVAIEDATGQYDDDEAGAKILELCWRWGALKVVGEGNRGVERLRSVIRAAHLARQLEAAQRGEERPKPMPELVPVTAREGKKLRAGPLRGLYIAGTLHHTAALGALERQQREWDPDGPKRPRQDDRIDWLVHAVHHLADLGDAAGNNAAEQLDGLAEKVRELGRGGRGEMRRPSPMADVMGGMGARAASRPMGGGLGQRRIL